MQTLYGIEVDDRVTVVVNPRGFSDGDTSYAAYISNQLCAVERTGIAAVHAAKRCLREDDAKTEREDAADKQRRADRSFIDELAYDLKIDSGRIDELLEIAARRSVDQ